MLKSKTVLDYEFHAVDSGFQVQDSGQWNFEFWIPVVNGIPDSLSCFPDSKAQDSGFYKQNFLDSEIREPDSLTLGEIMRK